MIPIIFLIIAAIVKAMMDRLTTDFNTSIFSNIKNIKIKNWFNPSVSWTNKYKNGIPPIEAFLGQLHF